MKIPSVYFHIGLHKTGSTWLQSQFFPSLPNTVFLKTANLSAIETATNKASGRVILSHEGMSGSIAGNKLPGDRLDHLQQTIDIIRQYEHVCGIIVGFREQYSWLNSSFSQKAKKRVQSPDKYLRGYSEDELRWCNVLDIIDSSGVPVFAFLYEELNQNPRALISDLCRFLRAEEPFNAERLVAKRVNLSPRSTPGRRVSRAFFFASEFARDFAPAKWALRRWGSNLGALFDSYFSTEPDISPDAEIVRRLRSDWDDFIKALSERRGRDLSALVLASKGASPRSRKRAIANLSKS